jgi:hypothetical protein
MKFIIAIIASAILAFGLTLFLPWWIVVLACLLVTLLLKVKLKLAFLMGFLAIFFLWGIQSFIIDNQNESILSARIGELFQGLSSFLIILLTAVVGGIFGGLGGQIGAEINRYIESK